MPYTFTAAYSSRITKPKAKKQSIFDRSTSSPFRSASIRKPGNRGKAKPGQATSDDEDFFEDRLADLGLVASLASDLSLHDVVPTMHHIKATMFDEMPQKAGMNSVRISEVLRFRARLPPVITIAHIHALVKSPTLVEREITQLTSAGLVKRVIIPGRGVGTASLGEGLVLVEDWKKMVKEAEDLDPLVQDAYLSLLENRSSVSSFSQTVLSTQELTSLMRAGFLTASSPAASNAETVFVGSRDAISGTRTSLASVSHAASGSLAAVGGFDAVYASGGGGSAGLGSNGSQLRGEKVQFALPNTGAFLKLLTAARLHLMFLLGKSKYNEAPLYLLRERWDGGIVSGPRYGRSKDPFSMILPGKTKKWKEFYGLKLDWVLAECLGGGMVECFETGTVGLGVRAI